MKEGEDSEVVVAPKVKKGKVTTGYNSDNFDEGKEKTQKKTIFESYDVIPESASKLNKIVSYDDTDSDSKEFLVYAFLFIPRLDLVCILYYPPVNNYLQMLTGELDFASFWTKN